MPLESRLKARIRENGPITLYEYMNQVLYDLQEGYYAQKVPIGRGGDYITAPEMTQVFGEVIALWMVDLWQQAGSPQPFHLIEMGPGRGTLMADILRTFISLKIPPAGLSVHLIETSPVLQDLQKSTLSPFPVAIHWHKQFSDIPEGQGFCLMVGNEFWDALPIQQSVKENEKWVKRRIGLKDGNLVFLPEIYNSITEKSPLMETLAAELGLYLKKTGGAALFLDYGYVSENPQGETLQALYKNRPHHPLANPGQADLTHHVNFQALKKVFDETGILTYGPISQGKFLNKTGLGQRTELLCKTAAPGQQGTLRTAAVRLTHPQYMGSLFKALAAVSPASLQPAGFGCPYLTASALDMTHLRHGFFTRVGGVSQGNFSSLNATAGKGDDPAAVQENRRRIVETLEFENETLVTVRQIHSAKVVIVDRPFEGELPEADALVTATPGLALGVSTADCVPVLLSSSAGKHVVAAVHAGWRGAVAGILENTIRVMEGLGAQHIVAALGPCIWQQSYEVSQEFYHEHGVEKAFFKAGKRPHHWQFDLPGYVMFRLSQAGINRIDPSPANTYADPARFFSYRRKTVLGEAAFGNSLSAIGIVKPGYGDIA